MADGETARANRVLICRPQGGLNDLLCQVERACAYAERHGRSVIVDTRHPSTTFFRDSFANYFVSREPWLSFDPEDLPAWADATDVLPACLAGRVNSHGARWDYELMTFVEPGSGERLSFDFERDHPQPVLAHYAMGGGDGSLRVLSRMRLHDDLVGLLLRRLEQIGPAYSGLHIRNSDYRTRYEPHIEAIGRRVDGPLFLASDCGEAVERVRAALGPQRVFSFSELPPPGQTLHDLPASADVFRRNSDAILDLVMLGLSRRLYAFALEPNANRATYSGFTLLADLLHHALSVLAGLIDRRDPPLPQMLEALAQLYPEGTG